MGMRNVIGAAIAGVEHCDAGSRNGERERKKTCCILPLCRLAAVLGRHSAGV